MESHEIHAIGAPRASALAGVPAPIRRAQPLPRISNNTYPPHAQVGSILKRYSAGVSECSQVDYMNVSRAGLPLPLSDDGPSTRSSTKGQGAAPLHVLSSKPPAPQNSEQFVTALRSSHSTDSPAQRGCAPLGSTMHATSVGARHQWCVVSRRCFSLTFIEIWTHLPPACTLNSEECNSTHLSKLCHLQWSLSIEPQDAMTARGGEGRVWQLPAGFFVTFTRKIMYVQRITPCFTNVPWSAVCTSIELALCDQPGFSAVQLLFHVLWFRYMWQNKSFLVCCYFLYLLEVGLSHLAGLLHSIPAFPSIGSDTHGALFYTIGPRTEIERRCDEQLKWTHIDEQCFLSLRHRKHPARNSHIVVFFEFFRKWTVTTLDILKRYTREKGLMWCFLGVVLVVGSQTRPPGNGCTNSQRESHHHKGVLEYKKHFSTAKKALTQLQAHS
jgi:hypothetical protein